MGNPDQVSSFPEVNGVRRRVPRLISKPSFARGLSNEVVELSQVVAGRSRGRKPENEITLFKQNENGIWYAALGSIALQEAKKRGLGKEIDRNLFLQKFKP